MSTKTRRNVRAPLSYSKGDRISKLLANIEELISNNNAKVTVFDFIQLAQLEPELEETETPREIKVT